MAVTLCVLGSGSSGNCTYVATDQTAILIDAGLSGREIDRRLRLINADIGSIRAVCLTHEHDDHTASLATLHKRFHVALFANSGTIEAMEQEEKMRHLPWTVFSTGSAFTIGDLRLEPFSVPHDSYDPVGFVVTCGAARIGIVTDMGMVTSLIREKLRNCQVLVVESNHDEKMLQEADRPWVLKQRIAGRQGHLSNRQAGELIREVGGPAVQRVFLAHLSSECNRPELALKAMNEVLSAAGLVNARASLTYPDNPGEVLRVES